MDLFLTAIGLYLWQCVVFLPLGGAVFVSIRSFRSKVQRGPGFRILSPWPGELSLVSGGFPFEFGSDAVYAPTLLPRGGVSLVEDNAVALDGDDRFRARGSNVVVGGRVFVRATSPHHAAYLAGTLRRLQETPRRKRAAIVRDHIDAAFDLSAFRTTLASSSRTVRPLRWCCTLYLVVAAGILPLLAWVTSGETALHMMLIPLGLAHLASLGALVFAETRSLRPGPHRGERFFIAAMFPPALLRTPSEWLSEQCVAFYPATAAAAVLDSETFTELVRREIAEVDHPLWQRHGGSETPCAAERRKYSSLVRAGLLSLLVQRDNNSTGVALRHPVDADAKSYCPLCLGDFRLDFRYCAPCGVATVAYEPIASPGERAALAPRSGQAEGHS